MLTFASRRRGPEAPRIAAKACYNSLETLHVVEQRNVLQPINALILHVTYLDQVRIVASLLPFELAVVIRPSLAREAIQICACRD